MADFKIRGVVPPVVVPDTPDHELAKPLPLESRPS